MNKVCRCWTWIIINLTFVFSAPFLYPLKTSENLTVFWCFQRVEKRCIVNKWVNLTFRLRLRTEDICKNNVTTETTSICSSAESSNVHDSKLNKQVPNSKNNKVVLQQTTPIKISNITTGSNENFLSVCQTPALSSAKTPINKAVLAGTADSQNMTNPFIMSTLPGFSKSLVSTPIKIKSPDKSQQQTQDLIKSLSSSLTIMNGFKRPVGKVLLYYCCVIKLQCYYALEIIFVITLFVW